MQLTNDEQCILNLISSSAYRITQQEIADSEKWLGSHPIHEIGIARYGTSDEGVSMLSIFATITHVLVGKRIAIKVDDIGDADWNAYEELPALGFGWLENNDEGEQEPRPDETSEA